MAATLAEVEEQAVLLAEDPGGADEPASLPGRTGAALHTAFGRLRSSILLGERQRQELHELATHDQLTGLLNRAAALDALERGLAGDVREGRRTMVLFIDVDGLKQINDDHGHVGGDAVLRLVADALRAATRASDALARYGGDEFLVIGSVDGPPEVEALAERIRAGVASEAGAGDERLGAVSCSIGMAVSGPGQTSPDALVRRADAALYGAKRDGRDRTRWMQESFS
jgi:diguanylate cyclase (GGDEF)-like protein